MMSVSRVNTINLIKGRYAPGTKIKLTADIVDPYSNSLKKGLVGKVRCVDDVGTIFADWENGSGLGLCYPDDHDKIKILT